MAFSPAFRVSIQNVQAKGVNGRGNRSRISPERIYLSLRGTETWRAVLATEGDRCLLRDEARSIAMAGERERVNGSRFPLRILGPTVVVESPDDAPWGLRRRTECELYLLPELLFCSFFSEKARPRRSLGVSSSLSSSELHFEPPLRRVTQRAFMLQTHRTHLDDPAW